MSYIPCKIYLSLFEHQNSAKETPSQMSAIGLLNSVFCRSWFYPPVVELWTDAASVQAWIEVESALAQEQARLGLIPVEAGAAIAAALAHASVDHQKLAADIALTMHTFVPVLRQLEALCGEPAAAYLHWGATTQNIVDTGMALQMQRSHRLLMAGLEHAMLSLKLLAAQHRATPMAGRTHGQHALPITFGLKVAGWRSEMRRHRGRLTEASRGAFVASMGGAVGAFSAMSGQGRALQQAIATRLQLEPAELPLRSIYDRQASYAAALVQMSATIEKIAGEVFTLQRTEVAEVAEGFHRGKVGSSTMAQKRNPGLVMNLSTLARLLRARLPLILEAMVRHDEGDGIANNICEVTLPEMACCAVSLVHGLATLVEGLEVNSAQMTRNLGLSGGLIVSEAVMMDLAKHLGRHHAHQVLYDVAQDTAEGGGSFENRLRLHPLVQPLLGHLNLQELLVPNRYLGESTDCVDDEVNAP